MHIVFIAPDDSETARLCEETAEWLSVHRPDQHPNLFLVPSAEIAWKAIVRPVTIGTPPALVIADHTLDHSRIPVVAEKIRSLFPESWVVELIDTHSSVPQSLEASALKKPIHPKEWASFLDHIFLKAQSPQWSRTTLHEIGF